jgi:hypothetical protein
MGEEHDVRINIVGGRNHVVIDVNPVVIRSIRRLDLICPQMRLARTFFDALIFPRFSRFAALWSASLASDRLGGVQLSGGIQALLDVVPS